MKLLIAGKNSYIGCHIGAFAREQGAQAEAVSVRDTHWKDLDLSGFDAVVFAAGIVHRKDATKEAYRRVNTELPFALGKMAKEQGVKQFLFLSTAAVYGVGKGIPGNTVTADTLLNPQSMYGKSKLEGERRLLTLADDGFAVSIVRPMNVYGKDCPGGYISAFQKLTRLLPVLPGACRDVRQGMVYIENLARLCWMILESGRGGVYHAQDERSLSSWELMHCIAAGLGKEKKTMNCEWAVRPLRKLSPVVKLFGGVAYSEDLAGCPLGEYAKVAPEEGLKKTVEENE